ncbi:MAG: hypothetical protein JSW67_12215 [Candidatus Latescibacterota bacterium]|nr:MAG: hypothetical protein JSW67_12215 [Candidatus Latescibacterota bacterium]
MHIEIARTLVASCLFATTLLFTSPAAAQRTALELYYGTSDDPSTTDFYSLTRDWDVLVGEPSSLYFQFIHVYARLAGSAAAGITGAEFFVQGVEGLLDAGFDASVTANPEATVVWGSPIQTSGSTEDRRYNIAFPECMAGQDGLVFLASIRIWKFSAEGPPDGASLKVMAADPPTNSYFRCPLVTLCDAPVFTPACVRGGIFCAGGSAVQRPREPVPADGATNVSPHVTLAWRVGGSICCFGHGVPSTWVYLGTSEDPPLVLWNDSEQLFRYDPPEALGANTIYYWRVISTHDVSCGGASGPVWSFTTSDPVALESTTWGAVKKLFRE